MVLKIVEIAKKVGWSIRVKRNVVEILEENRLKAADIEAVI